MAFTTPRSSTAPAGESSPAAGDLPAGEVTFLFTDIEGSTRAWEQHRTAMPAALAIHQAVVRGAIDGCGGTVVKDTGDGVLAVFPSARAAMLAAVGQAAQSRDRRTDPA